MDWYDHAYSINCSFPERCLREADFLCRYLRSVRWLLLDPSILSFTSSNFFALITLLIQRCKHFLLFCFIQLTRLYYIAFLSFQQSLPLSCSFSYFLPISFPLFLILNSAARSSLDINRSVLTFLPVFLGTTPFKESYNSLQLPAKSDLEWAENVAVPAGKKSWIERKSTFCWKSLHWDNFYSWKVETRCSASYKMS